MAASSSSPKTDVAALTALLRAMHDRRDVLESPDPWEIVGAWRSFKADFVHVRTSAGDVAVKFGDGWTPEDARYVAAEVDRVAGLFADLSGERVLVPPSLGWSESPAAVALDFVDGSILFNAMGEQNASVWESDEQLQDIVTQCGRAIGAYHTAQPATDDEAIAAVALEDLLTAARRAGIRRSTILAVEPRLARARGYRFSPNDFIVDRGGNLVMLDPPHVRKYDYLQRDVSAFTFELHSALVGQRRLDKGHPRVALLASLRAAFLDGYAATGPKTDDSALDDWMLRFYEISRITGYAYAQARRKQAAKSAGALAWAAQLRLRLGAPPS